MHVGLGETRVIVLPTGISCALQAPARGAMALALHALNLVIMRQLVSDIERCAGVVDVVTVPPLCPLSTTRYDFSQSAALIHRSEAATRLITGQVVFNTSRGKIAVSGILREIRADSKTPAVVDQACGGAVSVAGVIPAVGKDDFRFTASAGNAIGRYSDGFFPDGVVGTDGQIRLPKQWGWFAAYRHFWSDQLRSNLVLSTASENNPAGAPASTNKSTQSAHTNLIWSPVPNTDLGIEYIYGFRETEDGLKGHLNRLQASAKYAF